MSELYARLTASERLFEEFAKLNALGIERIPTEVNQRTPDYILKLLSQDVAVEVTTVYATAEGDTAGGYTRTIGDAVRRKITDKRTQLYWAVNKQLPSLLLLHESRDGYPWFLEDHDFKTAMYGAFTIRIGRETRKAGPMHQHGNAKMRLNENTHFSALGRIVYDYTGSLRITIFPNLYASLPVPTDQWQQCFDVVDWELEFIDPRPSN